jgi:hypothetical protein
VVHVTGAIYFVILPLLLCLRQVIYDDWQLSTLILNGVQYSLLLKIIILIFFGSFTIKICWKKWPCYLQCSCLSALKKAISAYVFTCISSGTYWVRKERGYTCLWIASVYTFLVRKEVVFKALNWIKLAQDRNQWHVYVNTALFHQVQWGEGISCLLDSKGGLLLFVVV